jgi:hypothetical protein
MYVNVKNVKPTRNNFFLTVAAGLIISALFIFDAEGGSDGRVVGYWGLALMVLYAGLGYLIIFKHRTRDAIFGRTKCPHCGERAWSLKEKFKITGNQNTNLGKCSNCKQNGKIPFVYHLPMFALIFSWLFFLYILNGIHIAFLCFLLACMLYLHYFARYVPISK